MPWNSLTETGVSEPGAGRGAGGPDATNPSAPPEAPQAESTNAITLIKAAERRVRPRSLQEDVTTLTKAS